MNWSLVFTLACWPAALCTTHRYRIPSHALTLPMTSFWAQKRLWMRGKRRSAWRGRWGQEATGRTTTSGQRTTAMEKCIFLNWCWSKIKCNFAETDLLPSRVFLCTTLDSEPEINASCRVVVQIIPIFLGASWCAWLEFPLVHVYTLKIGTGIAAAAAAADISRMSKLT